MFHFGTIWQQRALAGLLLLAMSLAETVAQAADHRIETGTSAAEVNRLLASARSGDRLLLQSGTHVFNDPIIIRRDGVTLQGAGSGQTILRFAMAEGTFMMVRGGSKGRAVPLVADAPKDATEITVADTSAFQVGEAVYISRPNTRSYLAQWYNLRWKEARNRPFREVVARIAAIDGNTLRLASPLPFTFPEEIATAQPMRMVKDVRLEGFSIESIYGAAEPNNFDNRLPQFNHTNALRASSTAGLTMKDIAIRDVPSSAFTLASSIDADIDGLTIAGSHNKGGGGNGYGVVLYEAFNNRMKNLDIRAMRHAVIFSAWHAEIGNDIHVAFADRDINFHGSVDVDNRVVVDDLHLVYAADRSARRRANVWRALSPGGRYHAETDFLSVNTVALKRASGSWRDDTLVGAKGASLRGGYGQDRFILTGSAVIEDFEAGDTIELKGATATGFEEKDGALVLKLEGGGEVELRRNADS